jgi:hypothetical protein
MKYNSRKKLKRVVFSHSLNFSLLAIRSALREGQFNQFLHSLNCLW